MDFASGAEMGSGGGVEIACSANALPDSFLHNASGMNIVLPDAYRISLSVGIILPTMMGGLLSAAWCMQPKGVTWRDRGACGIAVFLVAFLSTIMVAMVLYSVHVEIANFSDQELLVQFCEAKFGGLFRSGGPLPRGVYLPEWGSMISATFIIYCGMHLLYFWVHDSAMLRLIAAMFCVNGISSFFYHMTNLKSWGETDGNSMLFLVWAVVAYMWDEFIETWAVQVRPLHPNPKPNPKPNPDPDSNPNPKPNPGDVGRTGPSVATTGILLSLPQSIPCSHHVAPVFRLHSAAACLRGRTPAPSPRTIGSSSHAARSRR